MQIVILQHTPDSKPYYTTEWLETNRLAYRVVKGFEGEKIPSVNEVDWLISLGGSMNVDDEKNFPFLREEKKLLEQVLKAEKSYLGICLGGQMLARVMGAEVRKHSDWEVGWFPVQFDNGVIGLRSRPTKEEVFVMQYHQDTFDLPAGAKSFAKNHITANQGFVTNNGAALGTQFHPEASEGWVRDCHGDIFPEGRYVQTFEEMIEGLVHAPKQSEWFADVLTHFSQRTLARVRS